MTSTRLRDIGFLLLEAWGWLLLSGVLVCVSTWPTAAQFRNYSLEPIFLPDVQGGMYWPWACAQALASGDPLFQRAELLWPNGQDVTLVLWNYGVQLILFPLFLAFDPIAATNLGALWIATLNGAAGAWAGWAATGRRLGALVGLIVAACAPYGFLEAGVGRPEQGLWAPMALFTGGLVRLWEKPADPVGIGLCGIGMALAGGVYWFYAIFLIVLMGAVLPISALTGGMNQDRLRALSFSGGIAIVGVLPFLLPVVTALLGAPTVIGDAIAANEPLTMMQSRASIHLPGGFGGPLAIGADRSWRAPLLLAPGCLAALIWARGGVRLVSGMGLLAAILAAGPIGSVGELTVYLPHQALNGLPGFGRFWWPYRWQAGLLAAACVALAWLACRPRRVWVWVVAVGVWSMLESGVMLRDAGVRPVLGPVNVPPVFAAIGALDGGPRPILQLPSVWLRNSRVGWMAWHHQPIDGGMGWGLRRDQATAHAEQLETLPVLQAARRASVDADYAPPAQWTAAQAGGYHYVILYNEGPSAERERLRRGLRRVLGPPFYVDRRLSVWAVTGVGQVPRALTQPLP